MIRGPAEFDPYERIPQQYPQLPPEMLLVNGEVPEPRFDRDFEIFRRATEGLSRQIPFEKQRPEGAVLLFNTLRLPGSFSLAVVEALRQRRYGIYITDDAVDLSGKSLPQYIAITARREDVTATNEIVSSEHILSKLLYQMAMRISYSAFLSTHSHHEAMNETFASLGGVHSEPFRRAFMTSTLAYCLTRDVEQGSLQEFARIDQQLYDVFRAQGIKPFTYEDIFGMGEAVVSEELRNNPLIPVPYIVQQRQENP